MWSMWWTSRMKFTLSRSRHARQTRQASKPQSWQCRKAHKLVTAMSIASNNKRVNNTIHKFLNFTIMANLILASKREVKSGAQMWHVYQHENGAKVAESEYYFSLPIKALKYAFLLRKRTGAIIPKAIYTKLMADVSASKAQAEPSESAPESEQVAELSALGKAYEQMKAKHPDSILLFRCGDFYEAYGDDAKTASEVLGITLTRTSRKDITAQMAGFPHHALDTYLPKLVRAGKRVAICDEPTKVAEKVEPAKKATRKSAKKESK